MKSILKDLDIIEINYSHSHLIERPELKINFLTLIRKIYLTLVFCIKQIVKDLVFLFKKNQRINNKHLLFYSGTNQYNALYPLKNKLENSVFVGVQVFCENRLFMGIGCIISIILAPLFIYSVCTKYKINKSKIVEFLPFYFCIHGVYYWWKFYLKLVKPKSIIFSNDHLVWHRLLRTVAKDLNIPTIYIQHASVTERFPQLEFDLSLLEGKGALDVYSKRKINGDVSLIGMIKFDNYFTKIKDRNNDRIIGICTNTDDNENIIRNVCKELRANLSNNVIFIRPHPDDRRFDLYKELTSNYNLILSDSNKENAFDFLINVDIIIAGNSSIHLEAVLMNVYPIYFKFPEIITDGYLYIKNRLIQDSFDNTNELVKRIIELSTITKSIRSRAKYYVDTVNTKYDGNSTDLCVRNISEFLQRRL